MGALRECRVEGPRYGGAFDACEGVDGDVLPVRFVLPGERVEVDGDGATARLLQVLESSPQRVAAPCPHFGVCGGCDYQHAAYDEQLGLKRRILSGLLQQAGIEDVPSIATHAGEPYGYRNRIRLRVERAGLTGATVGYNERGSTKFLAIGTRADECPIASPVLLEVAAALLRAAAEDREAAFWLAAASEVELFCNHDQTHVQVTLLCAPRTKSLPGSFARAFAACRTQVAAEVRITGAATIASDERTGPTGRVLAEAGSAGLAYRVLGEMYWISRGGFFQVNRFLVETLVKLVTNGRTGALAWDLYAGVGLFSRVLARSFAEVVAVEANPAANADNRAALAKISGAHRAVPATTLEFLRGAALQRERPELVVLDPPRAGVGAEACALLVRLAPRTIVYVSCDPTTLARDLTVLAGPYRLSAVDLVDLFPQTFHLETVVVLELAINDLDEVPARKEGR